MERKASAPELQYFAGRNFQLVRSYLKQMAGIVREMMDSERPFGRLIRYELLSFVICGQRRVLSMDR